MIQFRDSDVKLGEGEMCVVPKGIEHRTVADTETYIMMIEPKSTAHTGGVQTDLMTPIEDQAWI